MFSTKCLLISGLVLCSQAALAVNPDKVKLNSGDFQSIPHSVAADGQTTIYICNKDYDAGQVVFSLYSETFDEKGEFTYNMTPYSTSTVLRYNLPRFSCTYYQLESSTGWTEGDAESSFLNSCGNYECRRNHQKLNVTDGCVFFCSENPVPEALSKATTIAAVQEYLNANPYCIAYATFSSANTEYAKYEFERAEVVGYTDETVETVIGSDESYVGLAKVCLYDVAVGSDYDTYLELTQTLFNDDNDYEILRLKMTQAEFAEEVSHSDILELPNGREVYVDNMPATRIRRGAGCEAIEVVKLNSGEVVATFDIPAEYKPSYEIYNVTVMQMGEKKFLYFTTDGDDENEATLLYDLNSLSAINAPMLVKEIKVNPTIVNQGEYINVAVGDNTEIEEITVTDMNGVMHRLAPNPGKRTATLGTRTLSKGMHVVGVKTSDASATKGTKIIVR